MARVVVEYVGLLPPTIVPFAYHWYIGEAPPLVGVAVKVTLWPAQIEVAVATLLTLGVNVELTVTDVTDEAAVHPLSLMPFTATTKQSYFS